MMADARRGRFDIVLVWASDRIARSVRHFLEVLDELNRLNIEFVSFREQPADVGESAVQVPAAVGDTGSRHSQNMRMRVTRRGPADPCYSRSGDLRYFPSAIFRASDTFHSFARASLFRTTKLWFPSESLEAHGCAGSLLDHLARNAIG